MSNETPAVAQPPIRFSLLTYNIWNTEHLEEREKPLEDFFSRFDADLICLQEVRPATLQLLDKFLPEHARIGDQKDEPGWMVEGNIYFRTSLFELVEFGAFDVGMKALGSKRRLWWVLLRFKATQQTVFLGTVHYTWEGHEEEVRTGFSPRVEYAHATVEFLQRYHQKVDAVLFCGDFNDRYHPRKVLQAAGYIDTTSQLSLPMRTTWPAPRWHWVEDSYGGVDFTCDWVFTCDRVKTISSLVAEHAHKGVNPSDHFPIMTVLQIKPKAK